MLKNYKETLKAIDNMFNNNRMSHAYLICGDNGTPKLELAKYIAKKFYCSNTCGICNSCRQINEEIHPNVTYIKNIGQTIKKEQITKLVHDFSLSSLVEGPRIYIIEEASKLNKYSANSILKFIEEPTNNIHAILTTSNLDMILPTIKSRCQIINLKSNDKLDLDVELEDVLILSNLTRSKEDAYKILDGDYNIIKEIVKKIYLKDRLDRISYVRENYEMFRNKDNLDLFIQISLLYLRDVSFYSHDIKTEIFEINKKLDVTKLIDGLSVLQSKLKFNVNAILALESFLLEGE